MTRSVAASNPPFRYFVSYDISHTKGYHNHQDILSIRELSEVQDSIEKKKNLRHIEALVMVKKGTWS